MSTAEVGERVNRMEFVYQPFTQQHPQAEEASQNDASVPQQGQASPDRQPASVSWSEIVAGVWLAGVVLLLALSGLFYVRVKRQLKKPSSQSSCAHECIRTVGSRQSGQDLSVPHVFHPGGERNLEAEDHSTRLL